MFALTGAAPAVAEVANKPVRKATVPKKPNAAKKPDAAKKVEAQTKKAEAPLVALEPDVSKPGNSAPPDLDDSALAAHMRGQSLERVNRRLALGAYREAARQGHGPSQKRLWELLKDTPGNEAVASVYQIAAWSQKVPGVPAPLAPIRFN